MIFNAVGFWGSFAPQLRIASGNLAHKVCVAIITEFWAEATNDSLVSAAVVLAYFFPSYLSCSLLVRILLDFESSIIGLWGVPISILCEFLPSRRTCSTLL